MKATKIEKAENGDYNVTLQCYNSDVVNKYFVPMPSGVAEYFFDFMKKEGKIVTKRKTITKNGNKCVFTLSFDTTRRSRLTKWAWRWRLTARAIWPMRGCEHDGRFLITTGLSH